ncbi:MAG TPA: ROK family protein, partial [Rhodobacteraceae bacterium]|nr:ROK family protein [Paracoccaceae bacterium]
RSANLLVMDFQGGIRKQLRMTYSYPLPQDVFRFLKEGLAEALAGLNQSERNRLCGIGVAVPFEIWNWHDLVGAPAEAFQSWKDVDFKARVSEISDLPLYIINDATAACQAEHVFGRGKEFGDYAYFYVGAFVGGGIVLNHSVYEGHRKNAGALGSLRTVGPDGKSRQLIDTASIHLLETRLKQAGKDCSLLWQEPQNWDRFSDDVEPWLDMTAQELAKASLSTCAVIDFEAVLIDGAFPANIRDELVNRLRHYLQKQDTRGLLVPRIETGVIGRNARAIGAACRPVFSQFLLNTNAGFSAA